MKKLLLVPMILLISGCSQTADQAGFDQSNESEREESTKNTTSDAFKMANNTQRAMDVNVLLNAIYQYSADRQIIPVEITEQEQEISQRGADICQYLVPDYLAELPRDPLIDNTATIGCSNEYSTGYFVQKNADGAISVSAPQAELNVVLEATR